MYDQNRIKLVECTFSHLSCGLNFLSCLHCFSNHNPNHYNKSNKRSIDCLLNAKASFCTWHAFSNIIFTENSDMERVTGSISQLRKVRERLNKLQRIIQLLSSKKSGLNSELRQPGLRAFLLLLFWISFFVSLCIRKAAIFPDN